MGFAAPTSWRRKPANAVGHAEAKKQKSAFAQYVPLRAQPASAFRFRTQRAERFRRTRKEKGKQKKKKNSPQVFAHVIPIPAKEGRP